MKLLPNISKGKLVVFFLLLLLVCALGYQYNNIQTIKENLTQVEGFTTTTTTVSATVIQAHKDAKEAKEAENVEISKIMGLVTEIKTVLDGINNVTNTPSLVELDGDDSSYSAANIAKLKNIVTSINIVTSQYQSLVNLDVTTTTTASPSTNTTVAETSTTVAIAPFVDIVEAFSYDFNLEKLSAFKALVDVLGDYDTAFFDLATNFDSLNKDKRKKINDLIKLINVAKNTDSLGALVNDLNTKHSGNTAEINRLAALIPSNSTITNIPATSNTSPMGSTGVFGGPVNWDALANSKNGVKFYFNEQSAVPESQDNLSNSGSNTSGVYRLPGAIINQTDFTGSTNVFSPIINMNKNIGESFGDNPYDDDDYYHL